MTVSPSGMRMGSMTCHRFPVDSDLVSRLGVGTIARSDVGEGFFREAGLWDEESSFLLLPDRYGEAEGVPALGYQLSTPLPPTEDGISPEVGLVHAHLTAVARRAAQSGEAVYLSRGGWAAPPNEEYVLFVAVPSDTGKTMSHVETFPHPGPGNLWDVFRSRREGRAVVARAPLEAVIEGVGPLLFSAASGFCPPEDMGLAFLRNRSDLYRESHPHRARIESGGLPAAIGRIPECSRTLPL
jgi:hypothetical protein